MHALVFGRYGPPDVLELSEVPTPEPGDGEVRVRIHAASVSSADTGFRRGDPVYARLFTGIRKPRKTILGMEFSGEIDAVGKDVTKFDVGDAVFGANGADYGGHAEYLCLPEDGALALKPDNVSHAEAAALCEGFLTALPFLRDAARLQRGQQVLINGAAGSVGSAAVQLAKHLGATVTGVCSPSSDTLLRSLGIDAVIDYHQEDFTRSGQTYDLIFDAVGKSSFSRCKGSLSSSGVYLTTMPSPAILVQMPWTSKIGGKKAKIIFAGLRSPADKARDLVHIRELSEAGAIRPVIGRCFPLPEGVEAHRYVETGHKKGSAILTMGRLAA